MSREYFCVSEAELGGIGGEWVRGRGRQAGGVEGERGELGDRAGAIFAGRGEILH